MSAFRIPPRQSSRTWSAVIAWGVAWLCTLATVSYADEAQLSEQYFQGLRGRGLYVLAEDYALSLLNDSSLKPAQRLSLTLELSRTLVAHGGVAVGGQRQELWQEAERVLESVAESPALRSDPESLLRLQTQLAVLPGEKGEILAWDVRLSPEDQVAREAAIPLLEQGRRQVQALRIRLIEESQTSNAAVADQVPRLAIREARYGVQAAELMPEGAERSGLLAEVAELMIEQLRDKPDGRQSLEMHLLWARSARLQGDFKKSASVLDSIAVARLRQGDQDRVLAERARLALAQGGPDAAYQLVRQRLKADDISDELRGLAVEILLETWAVAGDQRETMRQSLLLREARSLNEQTRGRWRAFTEARLRRWEEDQDLGPELARALRRGRGAWQAGDLDLAIDQFGQAAMLAHRQGRGDRAVEYALTRGSILVKSEKWEPAVAALGEIVRSFPEHPQAADADLLRAYALGKIWEQRRDAAAHEQFVNALDGHVHQFKNGTTHGEALWMLGNDAEQRESWTEAIGRYRSIPAEHARRDAAHLRELMIFNRVLASVPRTENPFEVWKAEAVNEARQIGREQLTKGTPLSLERGEILIRCARMLLDYAPQPDADEDRFLAAVTSGVEAEERRLAGHQSKLPEEWLQLEASAVKLRIVSLTAQGQLNEARDLMMKIRHGDPVELLAVLSGLTDLTTAIAPEQRRELGNLQRLAVQEISRRRGELTAPQQRLLDESAAQAHRASDDLIEAATRYESLLQQTPQDRRLTRELIDVHLALGEKPDLEKARERWKLLERLEKPGTPAWIDARLNIVEISLRLGDNDGARKLLSVTQTLYPQMGTTELKTRAESLSQRLPKPKQK